MTTRRPSRELKVEDQIERAAFKRSEGDAALLFHHRALLAGERAIRERGKLHWVSYLQTKALPQYPAVEQSVIQAWRRFLTKTMGIAPRKQADNYAVNCAIVLDALLRKPCAQHPGILKRNVRTFCAAAERGDTTFLQAVGRLLSGKRESDYLKRFAYAFSMLSHWLIDYYWLMPAKLVSRRLSLGLGVKDNLRSFLAAKSRYGLKSHRPTLIAHFDLVSPGVETIRLTQEGKHLLAPQSKRPRH